jgi:hypothetical protein
MPVFLAFRKNKTDRTDIEGVDTKIRASFCRCKISLEKGFLVKFFEKNNIQIYPMDLSEKNPPQTLQMFKVVVKIIHNN